MNEFLPSQLRHHPASRAPSFSTDILEKKGALQESCKIFVEHARGLRDACAFSLREDHLILACARGMACRIVHDIVNKVFVLQVLFFKKRLSSFSKNTSSTAWGRISDFMVEMCYLNREISSWFAKKRDLKWSTSCTRAQTVADGESNRQL